MAMLRPRHRARPAVAGAVAALAAATALLAGCAPVPRLGAAPRPAAPDTFAATQSFAAPERAWPADRWWQAWRDPALDRLIEEGLAGSPDIATAAARLRKAEGLRQQAGAALAPTLNAAGEVVLTKQSYNEGIPAEFVPKGWQGAGQGALSANLDLDLWGRRRAALAAATSEAEAARVDLAQARLILTTAIAEGYAQLAQLYADRDVAADAARVRADTVRLTAQRVRNGLDTRGELRQADARLPAARADIAALDEAIGLTRNRLAALIGAGPDRGLAIARPAAIKAPDFGLPSRLALSLVGRRPDIVASRLRAEAAASRIKAARAAFYPDVNLAGLIGVESLGLGNLVKGSSTYGSVGPAITLPLFEGGQLSGAYRGARADYDAAVASYDSTLLTALHEVADAATSQRALAVRLAEQKRALAAAGEAYTIARMRYQGGLANQLTVLTAEDTLLASRRAVADLEARGLLLDVALVRALGGGFRTE